MIRAPPTPTRTYPLFPYTTLFLSEMVYIGFGTKGLDELGFVPLDGGCAAVLAGDGERPHLGGEPGAGPERGESGPAGGGSRRRARPPDSRRRPDDIRRDRCLEREADRL